MNTASQKYIANIKARAYTQTRTHRIVYPDNSECETEMSRHMKGKLSFFVISTACRGIVRVRSSACVHTHSVYKKHKYKHIPFTPAVSFLRGRRHTRTYYFSLRNMRAPLCIRLFDAWQVLSGVCCASSCVSYRFLSQQQQHRHQNGIEPRIWMCRKYQSGNTVNRSHKEVIVSLKR